MRAVPVLVMMMATVAASAGDELEPLDGAFLEYLANMEDGDDDWTLLDGAERSPAEAGDETQSEALDGKTAKPAGTGRPVSNPPTTDSEP